MGKEGIKVLNDVDYIIDSIMVPIAGKSREYCAEPADALLPATGMRGKGGLFPSRIGDFPIGTKAPGIGNRALSRWAIACNPLK